jgi:hypothetical protein
MGDQRADFGFDHVSDGVKVHAAVDMDSVTEKSNHRGTCWQGCYAEAGVGEQPVGKPLTGHMVQAAGIKV